MSGGDAAGSPFTEADFQRILDEEKSDSAQDGWLLMNQSRDVETWRKKVPDIDIHLVKGFLHLPGVSAEDAVEMITNLDIRSRWDKQFYIIETLETHEDYKVVYWVVGLPSPCSDRDIVQYTTVKQEPGQTIVLYKNADYEKPPVRPNLIRGETILSGTIIRPDPEDPNSSKVSILIQSDLKGWIPKFVINLVVSKAPGAWRKELLKFYNEVYSKEKEAGKG
jgi:hypothetical protein